MFRFALFVMTAGLLELANCTEAGPPQSVVTLALKDFGTDAFRLPRPENVERVTVQLYDNPWRRDDVPQFQIDRNKIDKLFEYFSGSTIDRSPILQADEIGTILIFTEERTTRITFYWFPQTKRMHFSYCGIRCTKQHIGQDELVFVMDEWLREQYRTKNVADRE